MAGSSFASSSIGKRGMKVPLVPVARAPPPPPLELPRVKCPCCRWRTVHCLISHSTDNPDQVFYKCPNHRRAPGGCDFFLWEEDYVVYLTSVGLGGGIEMAAEDDMSAEMMVGYNQSTFDLQSHGSNGEMAEMIKKMDELTALGWKIFWVCLLLVALMVLVVARK